MRNSLMMNDDVKQMAFFATQARQVFLGLDFWDFEKTSKWLIENIQSFSWIF